MTRGNGIAMISDQAQAGLDFLLTKALQESFGRSSGDVIVTEEAAVAGSSGEKVIIFTVASYLFKLMVILHFSMDDATKGYFLGDAQEDEAAREDQALIDAVSESGNLCCGILSRELGRFFPHIGMSTPNMVDKRSMPYLAAMDYGYLKHFHVDLAGQACLHASLCVFDYDTLDFMVDMAEESSDTGELELF